MNKKFRLGGFTLIELLVYAAGIMVVLGVSVGMFTYSYSWYGSIIAASRSDQIGSEVVNRVISDIRAGVSTDDGNSVFGTNSSILSMTVMIAPGTTVNRKYALSGGRITFQESGGQTKYVTPTDISVYSFKVNKITTSAPSTALRISLVIPYTVKGVTATTTYSGLAIMRNSYQ